MAEFCGIMTSESNNSLTAVILALLNKKKMKQADLADLLNTTGSNLSARLKAGSMKSSMLKKIGEILEADIIQLMNRYEHGESLHSVIEEQPIEILSQIELKLTPEEVKQVMINQQKSQEELQDQFNQLVSQIKTWIQHDQEKMRKQDEIINMLMDERSAYKSKSKK